MSSCSHQYLVLMVDDDLEDIYTTEKVFSEVSRAIVFRSVTGGEALFAQLSEKKDTLPDLILLDLNMPKLSGFDVLERLKAHPFWAEIPVFVISTTDHHKDEERAMALGATKFFTKVTSLKAMAQWAAGVERDLIDIKRDLT